MRVAMVTPMMPESAIADVMLQAMPALTEHWEIDIWCPAAGKLRPSPVHLIPFARPSFDVLSQLGMYDLVIYVLGDSMLHHPILPLARALPGLVVLHDAALTNFVLQSARADGTIEDLIAHSRQIYSGKQVATLHEPQLTGGGDDWLRFCRDVPLTEYVAETSLGAVVHSRWHAERIDGTILGDITVAPLPVPSSRLGFSATADSKIASMLAVLPTDAFLVVTTGHVNSNRGLDVMLRSIANDPDLERVHLWAVGPNAGPMTPKLIELAESLGINERFRAPGAVSDLELSEILGRADAAAALRDPVLEGQSASVLTQMLAGRAVIVYDHAHYSELPDAAVVKVNIHDGATGIRHALRNLIADPEGRAERGARAREYVRNARTGEAYAEALMLAGERALAAKARIHLVQDLTGYMGRLGFQDEPVVVDRVTDLAFDLFNLS